MPFISGNVIGPTSCFTFQNVFVSAFKNVVIVHRVVCTTGECTFVSRWSYFIIASLHEVMRFIDNVSLM